jgi:multisubunit Na+/H+ antiporter MnhB subunit
MIRKINQSSARFTFTNGILSVLIIVLSAFLIWALKSLPAVSPNLRQQVLGKIEYSGVTNPVTAVLLNFRAYDTLLEIGVLLLVVVGVWSFSKAPSNHPRQKFSPVLFAMVRILVPLMILIAGYTLWIGGHAPGGAFQSGAILGAAAVFWLVTRASTDKPKASWVFRLLLIAGFSVFLWIAFMVMLAENNFMQYPSDWAGSLILCIEAAAALSIGATLAALFWGGRPRN